MKMLRNMAHKIASIKLDSFEKCKYVAWQSKMERPVTTLASTKLD